jgi:hypothetical protein
MKRSELFRRILDALQGAPAASPAAIGAGAAVRLIMSHEGSTPAGVRPACEVDLYRSAHMALRRMPVSPESDSALDALHRLLAMHVGRERQQELVASWDAQLTN